jgi:methanogenic corrinoid protein MtbC1
MASSDDLDRPRHTIRVVARRTGLTPTTLRAWERRYGAVQPSRSDTERRLYTDADIERLRLIRVLAASGHGLAHIAPLPLPDLKAIAATDQPVAAASAPRVAGAARASAILERCERAVLAMDGTELHRVLVRLLLELGPESFLHDAVVPLCRRIGDLWEQNVLSVAHEHVASVAIRQSLDFLLDRLRYPENTAPHLVVTTPSGERHEFGAMMAAAVALSAGWRVTYLGPDLPAREVVSAMAESGVDALALSIVSRARTPQLVAELRQFRESLGGMPIVVGGAGAQSYAAALLKMDAHLVRDLRDFRAVLDEMAPAFEGR